MPRDGAGSYNLPTAAVATGTAISSADENTTRSDIATALTQSLSKDGQTVPTANLPMGTYRHTGVGNGVARTDYAALGQVQDGAVVWGGVAGGTANAITLTLSPAIPAYAAGLVIRFITGASANTSSVTLNVNGVGAVAVNKGDGVTTLAGADLPANSIVTVVHDGTRFRLIQVLGALGASVAATGSDAAARAVINAPALPTLTTGIAGTVIYVNTSSGAGYTTPSAGNWFYFLNLVVTATAANTGTQVAGVAGPSVSVAGASAGNQWQGFVWRIS